MSAQGNYKWRLRKSSKKEICPQCGQRRFVPFVLTADGSTLAGSIYGRCDREQHCGYFRHPGREVATTYTGEPLKEQKKKPLCFQLPGFEVTSHNSLFNVYKNIVDEKQLAAAMRLYHIGTTNDGYCIYPQYDGVTMRTAKMIRYGSDGHRNKDAQLRWWHCKPQYTEYRNVAYLFQCFFGQHILELRPNAEVRIVEGEKTALLMEAIHHDSNIVWLACGGSQMLKGSIDVRVLRGRNVTLFPDDGQFVNWQRSANKWGWQLKNPDEYPFADELPDGYDIWDSTEFALKFNRDEIQRLIHNQ